MAKKLGGKPSIITHMTLWTLINEDIILALLGLYSNLLTSNQPFKHLKKIPMGILLPVATIIEKEFASVDLYGIPGDTEWSPQCGEKDKNAEKTQASLVKRLQNCWNNSASECLWWHPRLEGEFQWVVTSFHSACYHWLKICKHQANAKWGELSA